MKLKPKVQKAIDSEDVEEMAKYGGGSDGFWYDLTSGGYFSPSKVLADKADVKKVNDAIKLLQELEEIYENLTLEF